MRGDVASARAEVIAANAACQRDRSQEQERLARAAYDATARLAKQARIEGERAAPVQIGYRERERVVIRRTPEIRREVVHAQCQPAVEVCGSSALDHVFRLPHDAAVAVASGGDPAAVGDRPGSSAAAGPVAVPAALDTIVRNYGAASINATRLGACTTYLLGLLLLAHLALSIKPPEWALPAVFQPMEMTAAKIYLGSVLGYLIHKTSSRPTKRSGGR